MYTKIGISAMALVLALDLGGCTTTDPYTGEEKMSNATSQSISGAAGGAVFGALICGLNGGRACPQLIAAGSAAGAVAGFDAGSREDAREARLLEEFRRAGIGLTRRGDTYVLKSEDAILFPESSSRPTRVGIRQLAAIGKILAHYPGTSVDLVGHNSSDENDELSRERARHAADVISANGGRGAHMTLRAVGSSQPLRSEFYEGGRIANRTVEVYFTPPT